MIGICRRTGRTLTGWEQFLSRVEQVMTTALAGRNKYRGFGSQLPATLSKNTNNQTLALIQAYTMGAFLNPVNGLSDFTPSRVVAERTASGTLVTFYGHWNGIAVEPFTVPVSNA
ncbi:phage baseplate protein [Vibrio fluvialis]|nr:phage baseplate protein [Vibrio fluvialis]